MERNPKHHSILTSFAVGTTFAFLVAGVLSVLFVYVNNVISSNQHWSELADKGVMLIDNYFENVTYDEVFSSPDSEEYKGLRYALREFVVYSDANCGYLYTINPERTKRTYLVATSSDEEEDKNLSKTRGLGATSTNPITTTELSTLDGGDCSRPERTNNEFGNHYCWYRVLDLPGGKGKAIFGLDQNVTDYNDLLDTDMWHFAFLIGLLLLGIAIVEIVLLRRDVVKPIQEVTAHMRDFARDGIAKDRLKIHRRDEIGEIALTFNQMTMDIEQSVQRIEEMTEERVAAVTELEVAKRIQQGLVPAAKHIEGAGYEIHAFARTARAVGGDFYDLVDCGEGRIALVIADVSGKGISAALFMSMFMTLLHEKLSKEHDPAQALNEANDLVAKSNPENMFVTVIAAMFDPTSGTLTYANAGHTPPLVAGSGYLEPDPGIALGLFEDAGIVNETCVLKPGDGIVFYTDGTTEANNPQKQFFGEERLAQAVAGAHGAEEAINAVVTAVDSFTGEAEQFDDLTLLSLFVLEHDERVWKATLVPELASFGEVREHLEELCDGDDTLFKRVLLACDEGLTNVASYSGASLVEYEISRTDEQISVCMADDGTPFDPLTYEADELEFEDFEFGGMGISFIKQSCDEIAYAYEDGKNVLKMTFYL